MKKKRLGFGLFWLGAAYIFGASWLAMWWVAPLWRNAPTEQFDGTVWAFGGPIFTTIALSVPVGILLIVIGILLYAGADRSRVTLFAMGAIPVALSMVLVPTLGYYPVLFGMAGGLILILFLAVLWYWARNRRSLDLVRRFSDTGPTVPGSIQHGSSWYSRARRCRNLDSAGVARAKIAPRTSALHLHLARTAGTLGGSDRRTARRSNLDAHEAKRQA